MGSMSAHRTGRAVFPHQALGRVPPHGVQIRPLRLLGREAQRLLESPEKARSSQAHTNLWLLDSSRPASSQGSFPPCRLCCPPSAIGTMSPYDFPHGSLPSRERDPYRLAAWALPCGPVCGAGAPHPLRPRSGQASHALWPTGGRCCFPRKTLTSSFVCPSKVNTIPPTWAAWQKADLGR